MRKITELNKKGNSSKGITLIALVITIIVLLILVGVSIATLTGDNGILTQADKASTETTKATALEKVQVEVLGSYGTDGNLDNDTLKKNLDNINGITGVPDRIEDTSFPLMVTVDSVDIGISKDGEVFYASYVQDGLLLRYDGIENTRSGNNPNATSWEDLSGNNNDGIFYNMNTDSGYYSLEEKGYVFLYNDSYIKSANKIGISGDANFTIEVVSNMWEDGKSEIYSRPTYGDINPAWWGSSSANVGTSCIFQYDRNNKKLGATFINNRTYSNEKYDFMGKTFYASFRKTKVGQIKTGDTDIGKINYNGQDVPHTYTGSATFTTNMADSEVTVGRSWQWGSENRTFYGSIQAVRIYNRVLTDEEIQRNYEIDKKRFEIL